MREGAGIFGSDNCDCTIVAIVALDESVMGFWTGGNVGGDFFKLSISNTVFAVDEAALLDAIEFWLGLKVVCF